VLFCDIQEIFQVRDHKDNLKSVAISSSMGKAASAGDNRFVCVIIRCGQISH